MNRIGNRVEEIFSHAVALSQAGKLRNTIYCREDSVFILSSDQTVLLRFKLRPTEAPFKHPVSFRADDYDSRQFYEDDGKIVFITEGAGFTKSKSCSTPGDTPDDIAHLFDSYDAIRDNRVRLHRDMLALLDGDLSHIEFSAPSAKLHIIQRNIYSGTVLTLTRKEETDGLGLGAAVQDSITDHFGPYGLRTNDFTALFSFIDKLSFYFPKDTADYCCVRSDDPKMSMEGVISLCRYDELGGITESRGDNNGRQEQEVRGHEQATDRPAEKPVSTRRCK